MAKTTKEIATEIKETNGKSVRKSNTVQLAPTGCTLLDLVTMEYPFGKIINIVGDSSSGKTLLAVETINAARQAFGDKVKWLYDDAERGFSFDTNLLYGFDIFEDSIDPDFEMSNSVEEFSVNVDNTLKKVKDDEFLIYVLDSLDSLSSEAELERQEERVKAKEEGKSLSIGTYAMEKQKFFSEFFRVMTGKIYDKKCLVLVISQVRSNIGVMFGKKYVRSGGKALDFYAYINLWLAVAEKHETKGRVTGVTIKAKTEKAKIARPYRECFIDIIFDYGVDDITSNINFLYDLLTPQGKRKSKKTKVEWDGTEYTIPALVAHIEDNNLEDELKQRTIDAWEEIEEAIATKRTKKR